MQSLTQIIIGSLMLSAVHVAIPNHWLPLIALSKSENWSKSETLWITAITGAAHTLSTIILGVVIGLLGYELSDRHQQLMMYGAPALLVLVGMIYFLYGLRAHAHQHFPGEEKISQKRTKAALILTLSFAMFLSPCLEIEAYYFTAGQLGWIGISTVSLIYFLFTVIGMVILVFLGMKGMKKLEWEFLERHEHKITGGILIFLGVLTYLVH
jgi:sulfite exporter TauE/SafE